MLDDCLSWRLEDCSCREVEDGPSEWLCDHPCEQLCDRPCKKLKDFLGCNIVTSCLLDNFSLHPILWGLEQWELDGGSWWELENRTFSGLWVLDDCLSWRLEDYSCWEVADGPRERLWFSLRTTARPPTREIGGFSRLQHSYWLLSRRLFTTSNTLRTRTTRAWRQFMMRTRQPCIFWPMSAGRLFKLKNWGLFTPRSWRRCTWTVVWLSLRTTARPSMQKSGGFSKLQHSYWLLVGRLFMTSNTRRVGMTRAWRQFWWELDDHAFFSL